jgi:tetratricopeptide (TPR) repeat protein
VASLAVKLAPEMAEAHRVLALGLHINLQLDEAVVEYKKTVELDPASRVSRSSLANLSRANGKFEEALALYNDLLKSDPLDRSAMAGIVLSLLELGRKEEATKALDTALATEPRNLALLSGAAYWFAAHQNYERAFELSRRAVAIEPRYTWTQIALVRSLIGMKSPVGAERAMRYARQYGKFPTLNYELANVLASVGFYDEAAEVLKESFTFRDGEIETFLAGRIPVRNASFMDLLAVERRASIYQPTAADTPANSKMLRDLLALTTALTPASAGAKLDETQAAKAAREFGSGTDMMRTFRQLYAATRLLRNDVALRTALELAEESRKGVDAALDAYVATSAVQADEYRDLRSQAIATGTIPDIADAQRSVLSNILRGRIEDTVGWILFNQDKSAEALDHLKKASITLPNGTPAWRNALWHLGVVQEQLGSNNEALESYILSFNSGVKEPTRRSTIENLYRKINGSLYGIDEKIGSAVLTNGSGSTTAKPVGSESAPAATQTSAPVAARPEPTPTPIPTTVPAEVAKPEPAPETTPAATATPPAQTQPVSEESLKSAASRLRSNIKITGRVMDANKIGLANVVVVLISPSGSVIASTTDNEGNYSFTVMPSQKTYR